MALNANAGRERTDRDPRLGAETIAAASFAGAVSILAGGPLLFAIITAGTIGLTGIAYFRSRSSDPGLAGEIVLVLAVLFGGLAMQERGLAAGLAVVVTGLLAARTPLHRFVRSILTETDLEDALIVGGATLVALPLVPDHSVGPIGALNPRSIWIIVVLAVAIRSAGHIAVRALGPPAGLAIAGLASGFISSIATISSIGVRAAEHPTALSALMAGAVLSTVSTVIQMSVVLAATSMLALIDLSIPMICAGVGTFFCHPCAHTRGSSGVAARTRFQSTEGAGTSSDACDDSAGIGNVTRDLRREWFYCRRSDLVLAVTHAAAVSVASLAWTGALAGGFIER